MKSFYLVLSLLFCTFLLRSQNDSFKWNVGLYSGVMGYRGDLSEGFWSPNRSLVDLWDNLDYLSYGISVERQLSPSWRTRLLYSKGQFIANDRRIDWDGTVDLSADHFDRALNVRTTISDVSLLFDYHFDNGTLIRPNALLAPFLTIGAGITRFNTFGDLFLGTTQRYFYWEDGTIRDVAQSSGAPGNLIEQDGDFETELSALQTEGVDYSRNALHVDLGLGLKIRLSDRFHIRLQSILKFTDTDYLDDVSGDYLDQYSSELQSYAAVPGIQTGSSRGSSTNRNDHYHFTSLSLHLNFGRLPDAFEAPVIVLDPTYALAPPLEANATTANSRPELSDSTAFVDPAVNSSDTIQQENAQLHHLDSLGYSADPPPAVLREQGRDSVPQDSQNLPAREEEWRSDSITVAGADYTEALGLALPLDTLSRRDSLGVDIPAIDSLALLTRDSLELAPDLPQVDTIRVLPEDTEEEQPQRDDQSSFSIQTENEPTAKVANRAAENADQLTERITQLEAQLKDFDRLAAANERSRDRQDQLDQKIDQMIRENEGLRTDIERLASAVKGAGARANDDDAQQYGEKIDQLLEENKALKSELQALRRARSQAPATNPATSYPPEGRVNDQQNAALRAEIDALKTSLFFLQGVPSNNTIDTLVTAPIQLPDSLSQQISGLQRKLLRLEERLAKQDSLSEPPLVVTMPVTGNRSELDSLRAAYETLQRQMTELEKRPVSEPVTPANNKTATEERAAAGKAIRAAGTPIVFFTIGSADLSTTAMEAVQATAQLLQRHQVISLTLDAFTDASGDPTRNLLLSQRRAEAVKRALVQMGIDAQRISMNFRGEDANSNPAYGRRVELHMGVKD